MAKKRRIIGLGTWILLGLGLVLTLVAPRYPRFIERGYSQALYRWLSSPLSRITGLVSISVAEILGLAGMLVGFYLVVRWIISLVKGGVRRALPRVVKGLGRALLVFALLYLSFYMLWGLNYSRLSFAEIAGLPVAAAKPEQLGALALALTERANALRAFVTEDERGVMTLSTTIAQMLANAEAGYQAAARLYPELGGRYGPPKGVLLSRYWSYTGICGIYSPFTAEANVNTAIPPLLLPATTAHEMAHQRGFAREDEANYLGYLACSLHTEPDFRYSGAVSALIHTMNALYKVDVEGYKQIRALYSEGLVRDLADWQEYWAKHQGPVERLSSSVNNTYLKANRQQGGIQSYGRMVDLLLAEFLMAEQQGGF